MKSLQQAQERANLLLVKLDDAIWEREGIKNDHEKYGEVRVNAIQKVNDLKEEIIALLSQTIKEDREAIVREIENFGDIWKLEKRAEETDSGCPKFTRVNRDIYNLINNR